MSYGSILYVNGQPVAAPYLLAHVPSATSGLGAFWSSKKKRAANKAKRKAKKAKRKERKAIRKDKRKKALKTFGKVTAGFLTGGISVGVSAAVKAGKKKKAKKAKAVKTVAPTSTTGSGVKKGVTRKIIRVAAPKKKATTFLSTPKGQSALAAKRAAAQAVQAESPVTDAIVPNELPETGGLSTGMIAALAIGGVAAVGGLAYLLLGGKKKAMTPNRRRRSRRCRSC